LHRQSEIVLNDWAREQGAANYAALPAESRAALQGRLTELTRHKTYDPRTDTIVLDTEHAKAFDELTKYYADVYGQGRNEYAIPAGALTDPAKQHQMAAFFWWTARAASTNRPGEEVTYTQNWPHEELIGNRPTGEIIVWSVISFVLLLAQARNKNRGPSADIGRDRRSYRYCLAPVPAEGDGPSNSASHGQRRNVFELDCVGIALDRFIEVRSRCVNADAVASRSPGAPVLGNCRNWTLKCKWTGMLGPDTHVFGVLREFFQQYGYWTIAFMLLLESAGVPAPGEATLLFASVLASYEHQLRLPIIIVVAVAASVLGDNAGYAVGYLGGRPLLDRYLHLLHINQEKTRKGERFFVEHGAVSIFLARFVDGLRIIAGPLAGALDMQWRRFLIFNFLGAAAWVTATVTIGALFGRHLDRLLRVLGDANLAITLLTLLLAASWWWKRHRSRSIRPATGNAGAD